MASLNKVFLIGNLTRDPEVRYLPSNQMVADLRLAVSRRFKSATGEDREETCFINVTVWGKQAETCQKYLSRGAPVMVEGRLKYDEWERDGQKQNRISVVGERIQFLGSPRRAQVEGPGGDSGHTPTRAPGGNRQAAPSASDEVAGSGEEAPMPGDDENLPF